MRYTRKFIQARFEMAMGAIGALHGASWYENEEGRNVAIVGAHSIDHNSAYGGYTIRCIANEHGGESCPFGMERHSASEFVALLNGIIGAARFIKDKPTPWLKEKDLDAFIKSERAA